MKRLIMLLLSAVCILAVTSSYAGDIPEGLLYYDQSEVYFGEVVKIDEDSITVIQRIHIKGKFVQDREITYTRYRYWGDGRILKPRKGKVYLIGKSDENNITFMETDGTDPATLKLTHITASAEGSMANRMQEYLNNGDFAEAEAKRAAREEAAAKRNSAKAAAAAATANTESAGQSLAANKEEKQENNGAWIVWAVSGAALATAAGFIIYKFCFRSK